jgi:hypothetical protein
LSIRAASIGIMASRALRDGARGIVRAVFERSFYATFGEAWICVGPPGLGEGPLNALSHQPVGVLREGDIVTIDFAGATVWSPPPVGDWRRESLAHGIAAFDAALPDALSREGLALLLRPSKEGALSGVLKAAQAPADALCRSIAHETHNSRCAGAKAAPGEASPLMPSPIAGKGCSALQQTGTGEGLGPYPSPNRARGNAGDALSRTGRGRSDGLRESLPLSADPALLETEHAALLPLLGLGPGLTPSGDDFLGGAMVALTGLGMTELRDALWRALSPHAATHTNDISRAHLAAAAEGYGSAALHALLDAVMAGDAAAMPARLATLAAVGHTSGWDAMAGAMSALKAAVRA